MKTFKNTHNASNKKQYLNEFMLGIIDRLSKCGRKRTAEAYTSALKSFQQFSHNRPLAINEIDAGILSSYETYLQAERGITRNSSSFYMRILRAVYNRAVEQELTKDSHPFRHIYTGVDKTRKRALQLSDIRHIKELDLSCHPNYDNARNLFLFSFCTRGMSFIDMAYLRKQNLQNGILAYKRHKTGQSLCIKWEKCMEELLFRLGHGNGELLLPILNPENGDLRTQYKKSMCLTNYRLHCVGKMAGLNIPLTMYVARHSWASIARSHNIPISIISEGMGHEHEKTTRVYLASLDSSAIDQANALLLNELARMEI